MGKQTEQSTQLSERVSSFIYNGERRLNFTENWRFQREVLGDLGNVQNPDFNDASWRKLNLPHDWSIELDFNADSLATHEAGYLDGGVGWYRKVFILPESLKGKRISIDFDGVFMDSTTYLNGKLLGNYPFGYNAFSYDITDAVYTDGRENLLVVKVNNPQPSSRWYSGSGIYRNVYLTVTDPVHVVRYGTFVTTPTLKEDLVSNEANINLKTTVSNMSNSQQVITVKSTITDENDIIVSTAVSKEKQMLEKETAQFEKEVIIESPKLWSLAHSHLYKLLTEVLVDGKVVDTYETGFGIRYFEFDAAEGFSLNGEYMKLHGACMHHDLGALGAATNLRAVERQLSIMKEMGVNSIRVTHNPASPELLKVANELGLLVVEEAFDSWNLSKKDYDYSRFFSTWAKHDIQEMVDRGKNEPSIIMWSIGNEIYDTTDENGVKIAKNLVRWVKEIDSTRPTTIGEDKTRADKVNVTPLNPFIKEIFEAVDIVGLNYSENNYAGYHEQNPTWKIYGAETSSATRSRGVYTHPYEYNQSTTYEDFQQSSYDNDYVAWGRTAEDAWKYDRDLKHIAGQYIWTGFDYIGEPTPYYNSFPANSSYFGAVDTAGFPKDIFYYYQSQWKKEPVLHLLPHWNWSEGETVRVLAYTNLTKVELFLNGQSLGENAYVDKKTSWGKTYKETEEGKTYLEWAVPFRPGVLKAVGKNEHNQIILEQQIVTAGKPARIQLTADKETLHGNGKDLSFISVDVVDGAGHLVPNAAHLVNFKVTGVGELVGVDNGNAASIERYKANQRQVFNGKALAIVQSMKQSGSIVLTATAEGLMEDTIELIVIQTSASQSIEVELDEQQLGAMKSLEPAWIAVDEGEMPVLPEMVQATYQSGITKFIPVTWHEKNSLNDSVTGSVEGSELEAVVHITTRHLLAVEQVTTATLPHQFPNLPTELTVYYSDGINRKEAVYWQPIPKDALGKIGLVNLIGHVGKNKTTTHAKIRVTDEIGREHNISRAKNGYHYPVAEASFTNANDSIEALHDDQISYGENPQNRWTNLHAVYRPEDWVSITFGDFGPVENDVDQIEFYWYANDKASHPASLQVEYKVDNDWAKVEDLTSENSEMKLGTANLYTFKTVNTSSIRVCMTAQPKKAIGITELKIFTKTAKANEQPKVSQILLGEENILEHFQQENGRYHYQVKDVNDFPEVTAIGEENTSITVVPPVETSKVAKVIAKSEDGKQTNVYHIHFS